MRNILSDILNLLHCLWGTLGINLRQPQLSVGRYHTLLRARLQTSEDEEPRLIDREAMYRHAIQRICKGDQFSIHRRDTDSTRSHTVEYNVHAAPVGYQHPVEKIRHPECQLIGIYDIYHWHFERKSVDSTKESVCQCSSKHGIVVTVTACTFDVVDCLWGQRRATVIQECLGKRRQLCHLMLADITDYPSQRRPFVDEASLQDFGQQLLRPSTHLQAVFDQLGSSILILPAVNDVAEQGDEFQAGCVRCVLQLRDRCQLMGNE